MEQEVLNPFSSLISNLSDGLDFIIANLPANPAVNDLNSALVEYIQNLFSYSSTNPLDNVELNSYLPSAINAYINNDLKDISSGQTPFVVLLLKKIKDVPPLQIYDFIADVEEQIGKSGLSLPEQNQLFMATAVAAACYKYWTAQINANPNPWAIYMNINAAVNIANLPYYITAAIQAALYFCFKGNYVTDSSQPPKISGPDYVTVLTASIGIAAGKVIFNWIQKININSIIGNDNIEQLFNLFDAENLKQGCFWACKSGCKNSCVQKCLYSNVNGTSIQ